MNAIIIYFLVTFCFFNLEFLGSMLLCTHYKWWSTNEKQILILWKNKFHSNEILNDKACNLNWIENYGTNWCLMPQNHVQRGTANVRHCLYFAPYATRITFNPLCYKNHIQRGALPIRCCRICHKNHIQPLIPQKPHSKRNLTCNAYHHQEKLHRI